MPRRAITWGEIYRRSPWWLRGPVLLAAGLHGFVQDVRALRRRR